MKAYSVFVIILLNLMIVACNGNSPVKANDNECILPPITDWEIFKEYYEDGTVKNLYPLRYKIYVNLVENSGIKDETTFLEVFKVDLKDNSISLRSDKYCVISDDSITNIEIRNALINHKLVKSIFPNYIYAGGDKSEQSVIESGLVCTFKEPTKVADCEAINSKFNAKIMSSNDLSMTVSFSKCTNLNEVAEAYFNTGLFKFVTPVTSFVSISRGLEAR